MEVHFKIGEIADMFEISIRALRLYDHMNIFKPEYTDSETGYRYYTADQIQRLNTILTFKGIGFKLNEIKVLLDGGIDAEELIKALKEKDDYWQNQIQIAKFNIENIRSILKSTEMQAQRINRKELSEEVRAHKMSRLVCLENIKIDSTLSEVLWL